MITVIAAAAENNALGKNNNLHSRDLIVEELFNK